MLKSLIDRIVVSGVAVVCSCMAVGCSDGAEDVRVVTVSVAPLEYFVTNIGGDSVSVRTLMGAGADPETFQPGMGVMRELNRSGNLLVTGVIPFEKEMVADIEQNAARMKVGVAGNGIEYMYGTHSHDGGHDHDGDVCEGDGDPDPHIWGSIRNAKKLAGNTLEFLKDAFPNLSDYFDVRYAAFHVRLDSIDREFGRRLNGVDAFVIWHPSLSYFARDYGLEQIALNLENKETSPLRLKEAAEHAQRHTVGAFFIPEGFARNRVATLSDAIGVEPTEVNFMDPDLERQLNAVVDALTSNNTGDGE